ncbi:MAG TPA: hypothetical protein VJ869_06450 [Sphaerochaeta sp.]|nr:hypothetical protein [Sphaerochaeta sp.]
MFLGVALSLFASPIEGRQNIYPVDSELHEAITHLYIAQGLSLPSTAGPWSKDELVEMLSRLDKAELSPSAWHTYEYVEKNLFSANSSFRIGLNLATELYLHANTTSYIKNEDWIYNYDSRKAPLSIPLELSISEIFYAYSSIELSNGKYNNIITTIEGESPLYGKYGWTTNLFHFWRPESIVMDANFPYRSFGSLGGNGWSFEIGRDKLSWGPGKTGNFLLGDHLQYHNQGRFTAYGELMKFTFVTSFFPHPYEIFSPTGETTFHNQSHGLQGLKMFMGYRLEWRIPGNKVGLAISESIMYQSKNGTLDLRILNPFMIYHNYYVLQHANSLITLELDYTPIPSLNFYTQIALDELAVGGERYTDNIHPNAMAFMLGASYSQPYKKGILHLGLEGVYTDPYMYLRGMGGNGAQIEGNMADTLNFIGAIRRWYGNLIYDQEYIGYRYGGDAVVGALEVGYKEYGSFSLLGHLFFMAHGSINKESPWLMNQFDLAPSGNATFFFDVGLSGSCQITKACNAYAGLDLLARINEWKPTYDVQLYLGIEYTF